MKVAGLFLVFAAIAGVLAADTPTAGVEQAEIDDLPPPINVKGTKAGSDDCFPPPPLIAALPFNDTGDTTGSTSSVDVVPAICSPVAMAAGPDHIWEFSVFAGNSMTFTVTTTDDDYDPAIWILSVCGDANSCVAGADNCWSRNAGGNPCGAVSDETLGPVVLAPGSYSLFVDSYYSNGTGDGPYALEVTGNLPVCLLRLDTE